MMIFYQMVLYFTIYSFLGWVVETLFCSLRGRKFIWRGFLAGPICPIYGFGSLLVLLLLHPFAENVVLVYVFGVILMTALEYFVSFLLEKVFKKSFWDYSTYRYNLNGRVNLIYSLFWGILCLILVYLVHPLFQSVVESLSGKILLTATIIILLSILMDVMYSVRYTLVFNRELLSLTALAERIDKLRIDMLEAAEEKRAKLEEDLRALLSQQEEKVRRFFSKMRRILNAFPKMRLNKKDRLSIRERISAYRNRK